VTRNTARQWPLFLVALVAFQASASAYTENFPLHKFKGSQSKHLQIKPLVSSGDLYRTEGNYEYRSEDENIIIKAGWPKDASYFLQIKEGGFVLVDEKTELNPTAIYRVDIDGNGLKDFIVFKDYGGQGSGSWHDMVEIFLKEKEGVYHRIEYSTETASLEDFVDLNGDGKFAVIIEAQTLWNDVSRPDIAHTYSYWDIYEFKKFKLANANAKHKEFPEFLGWTFKPYVKDPWRMSREAKEQASKEKDISITYRLITSPWRGDAEKES